MYFMILADAASAARISEDARPWSTRLSPGDVDEIASATGISATGESAGAVQLAP
jgi:hypothetical protein